MRTKNKVWLVTGASRGLGLSLVKRLLAEGYRVAATSRWSAGLRQVVNAEPETFLALQASPDNEQDIKQALQETVARFGQINVLVNNAGYGLAGALEELSDTEARRNFDINVFGTLHTIRNVLPYMRRQQGGHIFNIASVGGFTGAFPGFGIYCATKFAVHGLSESLHAEVKPFGIGVTVVSPGYFRTDFLSSNSLVTPSRETDLYPHVREVQSLHQHEINGKQDGDPDKAARAIIHTYRLPEPPLHLFLGADAYRLAEDKIKNIGLDMQQTQALATATGFDK